MSGTPSGTLPMPCTPSGYVDHTRQGIKTRDYYAKKASAKAKKTKGKKKANPNKVVYQTTRPNRTPLTDDLRKKFPKKRNRSSNTDEEESSMCKRLKRDLETKNEMCEGFNPKD